MIDGALYIYIYNSFHTSWLITQILSTSGWLYMYSLCAHIYVWINTSEYLSIYILYVYIMCTHLYIQCSYIQYLAGDVCHRMLPFATQLPPSTIRVSGSYIYCSCTHLQVFSVVGACGFEHFCRSRDLIESVFGLSRPFSESIFIFRYKPKFFLTAILPRNGGIYHQNPSEQKL